MSDLLLPFQSAIAVVQVVVVHPATLALLSALGVLIATWGALQLRSPGLLAARLGVAGPAVHTLEDLEFQQSFRTVYGGHVSPDLAEVMETRAVDPEQLAAEFAKYPQTFTPWFRQRAMDLELFSSWPEVAAA